MIVKIGGYKLLKTVRFLAHPVYIHNDSNDVASL